MMLKLNDLCAGNPRPLPDLYVCTLYCDINYMNNGDKTIEGSFLITVFSKTVNPRNV